LLLEGQTSYRTTLGKGTCACCATSLPFAEELNVGRAADRRRIAVQRR
jgi:hypothetical protein